MIKTIVLPLITRIIAGKVAVLQTMETGAVVIN
jgi:hypothetical protein